MGLHEEGIKTGPVGKGGVLFSEKSEKQRGSRSPCDITKGLWHRHLLTRRELNVGI